MHVIWKFGFEQPFSAHFKETQQVWMITKIYSFISSAVPYLISGKTTQIIFLFYYGSYFIEGSNFTMFWVCFTPVYFIINKFVLKIGIAFNKTKHADCLRIMIVIFTIILKIMIFWEKWWAETGFNSAKTIDNFNS